VLGLWTSVLQRRFEENRAALTSGIQNVSPSRELHRATGVSSRFSTNFGGYISPNVSITLCLSAIHAVARHDGVDLGFRTAGWK
jgi:hypothetical protein